MRVLLVGGEEWQAARVAAALTRGGFTVASEAPFDLMVTLGAPPHRLQAADIRLDLVTRRAARRLPLTPIEFALLAHLAREMRTIGRAELLRAIWGYAFDPGTNLVAVHMFRLRAKVGPEVIESAPGGYRLAPADLPRGS